MSDGAEVDRVSMIVLRAMRWPLTCLFGVYVIGMAGFALIPGLNGEPLSFFHALYILSYTATTTGFGELPDPFSAAQRLWVIGLLHVTVIAWLYSIGSILRLIQNEHFRRALARYAFARRVRRIGEPFVIVCGFGDAGSLLARSLDDSAMAAVVVDNDPDRIKALKLRDFDVQVHGVCANAASPNRLLEAGLRHPWCRGVVAVTDDERVNATVAVMTRALNPALRPMCRVESRELGEELETLGGVLVLDSFEVFAARLASALHRPAVHALGNWFAQVADANLDYRIDCPRGRWILCGYGRMGQRLEEHMRAEGIRMTVIDPGIDEDDAGPDRIRGSADRETLARADVAEAACVIVATDDDTTNLRITMTVQSMNPDAYLVVRQNLHANEVAFLGGPIDLVVHPDRVLARRIQFELISPGLQPLLDHLERGSASVLDELMTRLKATIGDRAPSLWVSTLNAESAPALDECLSRETPLVPLLGDLLRDPGRREACVDAVALQLERDGELHHLPSPDTTLAPGDRILFCGTWRIRSGLRAVLADPYALDHLVTGREPPRSYLFRWLDARRERAAG